MRKKCNHDQKNGNNTHSQNEKKKALLDLLKQDLSPEKVAVITALLTNALSVNSVLLDKDQTVQIVLEGSLRKQTKMDKLLDEMSGYTIGDLLDSINNR